MSRLRPRFFVTGGTGFVGRRLVDVLRRELGADVTVLAHRTSVGALCLAARGVKMDFTTITDATGLARAIAGHDAVFHLAYGRYGSAEEMRATTIDGTNALVDAALAAGVKRFVNVSTAAVYFGAPEGVIDETAPRRKWGWDYSDEKLVAEETVRSATKERGLHGSILQVAGVYGPGGETFVVSPIRNMRRGIVVLPNYGNGIANMTYVDDVVQALILGLKDQAIGETFIIKGPGTVTRMEAYRWLESMLGYEAVEGMSVEEVKGAGRIGQNWAAVGSLIPAALEALKGSEHFKSTLRETPLFPLARKVKGLMSKRWQGVAGTSSPDRQAVRLERIMPPQILVDYLSARVAFSSAKAERLLDYSPRVTLDEGMARTTEWAKWAGLIGPRT